MTSEPEERLLVGRARDGDARAFAELIRSHQDMIYGLVLRLVRQPASAEELAQDVFLKAYRNLQGFRGDARFSTWLYRIAINLCRDHLSSRAYKERASETSLASPALSGFDPPSAAPRPDEQLAQQELAAQFNQSLDRLELDYREPFLLRHQEGRSYAEIATILGISTANAKVRVHRAREMILRELRTAGYDV